MKFSLKHLIVMFCSIYGIVHGMDVPFSPPSKAPELAPEDVKNAREHLKTSPAYLFLKVFGKKDGTPYEETYAPDLHSKISRDPRIPLRGWPIEKVYLYEINDPRTLTIHLIAEEKINPTTKKLELVKPIETGVDLDTYINMHEAYYWADRLKAVQSLIDSAENFSPELQERIYRLSMFLPYAIKQKTPIPDAVAASLGNSQAANEFLDVASNRTNMMAVLPNFGDIYYKWLKAKSQIAPLSHQ